MNISEAKEENVMSELHNLGKINVQILEQEFGKIQTDEIIVTNERIEHIKERHPEDYALFEKENKKLKNSVMTFYRIRRRNLKKLIDKNRLLYKKE